MVANATRNGILRFVEALAFEDSAVESYPEAFITRDLRHLATRSIGVVNLVIGSWESTFRGFSFELL